MTHSFARRVRAPIGCLTVFILLAILIPVLSVMRERPEEPWKTAAREKQRIVKMLDAEIAKCDPWSRLSFEVNGAVFYPQAKTVAVLVPVDATNIPGNICKEQISLKEFMVRIPYPEYVDPQSHAAEKPGSVRDYRRWWFEQRLPFAFTISAAAPGNTTALVRHKQRVDQYSGHKLEPVRELNFNLPAPYEAWRTDFASKTYYFLRKGGEDTDILSCLHDLFNNSGTVALICASGTLFASGKVWLGYETSFARRTDQLDFLQYSPKDAMVQILAVHRWINENMAPTIDKKGHN